MSAIDCPKIESGEVDCPTVGCGGSIEVTKKKNSVCGRCRIKVHFYRRRGRITRMTFHVNGNGSHCK